MLTRCSRTAGWPSTAPPWAASDLDSVTVRTTWSQPGDAGRRGRPCPWSRPRRAHEPRRPAARRRAARRSRPGRPAGPRPRARVDRLDDDHGPRHRTARRAAARTAAASLWAATATGPGTGARASISEACTWASETTSVSASARAVRAPRLAGSRSRTPGRCRPAAGGAEALLQLLVQRQGAGDQPRGAGAAAVRLRGGHRPGDDVRAPQQPEVVVARQVRRTSSGA